MQPFWWWLCFSVKIYRSSLETLCNLVAYSLMIYIEIECIVVASLTIRLSMLSCDYSQSYFYRMLHIIHKEVYLWHIRPQCALLPQYAPVLVMQICALIYCYIFTPNMPYVYSNYLNCPNLHQVLLVTVITRNMLWNLGATSNTRFVMN